MLGELQLDYCLLRTDRWQSKQSVESGWTFILQTGHIFVFSGLWRANRIPKGLRKNPIRKPIPAFEVQVIATAIPQRIQKINQIQQILLATLFEL
jgi:hypothetical protein